MNVNNVCAVNGSDTRVWLHMAGDRSGKNRFQEITLVGSDMDTAIGSKVGMNIDKAIPPASSGHQEEMNTSRYL